VIQFGSDDDVPDVVYCDGEGCSMWELIDSEDMPDGWISAAEHHPGRSTEELLTFCGRDCLLSRVPEPQG